MFREKLKRGGRFTVPPEAERLAIVVGLIELRKQGQFHGVWCEGGTRLMIRKTIVHEVEYISWREAIAMIQQAAAPVIVEVSKKPARREGKNANAARTAQSG